MTALLNFMLLSMLYLEQNESMWTYLGHVNKHKTTLSLSLGVN